MYRTQEQKGSSPAQNQRFGQQHDGCRGFIILYAVVIAAVVSLMTAGIFSVAFRESVIANTAAQSMRAFYMADSGLECAFLHDFKGLGVGTTDCDGSGGTSGASGSPSGGTWPSYGTASDFALEFSYNAETSCAHTFINIVDSYPGRGDIVLITSRGFNVCAGGDVPNSNDPRLVERRLTAWYPSL